MGHDFVVILTSASIDILRVCTQNTWSMCAHKIDRVCTKALLMSVQKGTSENVDRVSENVYRVVAYMRLKNT